ncbi:NAD(P)/FAD-dependent oxidoreductase [Georgenia sp. H159]|uniref:NAD(P)/FAD-dependent oxidoreductase n=1 Tax=Georgenia sp. H159 TaxID=3076115 RepID=UPI002D7795D8|nr:FAD-dependent oxidoreductase [Georgenia sp. H159]
MSLPSRPAPPPSRVTVVGTGLAGLRTAAELRAQGFAGVLTVVGAESLPPYDRPPLSKELFSRTEPVWLADEGYGELPALADELLVGHRAVHLEADDDDARLAVDSPDGRREVASDVVVLATGAGALTVPGWRDVLTLHDPDDAERLRERLRPGVRLAVIGAGWIGAELASVAAEQGAHVTVLEGGPVPLGHVLGPDVGELVVPWYEAHGVELRCGATVTGADAEGVELADGERLAADVVVAAVGVRPHTRWLSGALPLTPRGAVPVDLAGRVRGGPASVRAVGDCADRTSPRDGLVAGAHWDGALNHPSALVADLLGTSGAPAPDPAPYVFSTQLGHDLTVVGQVPPGAEVVLRGEPGAGPWTALYVTRDADGTSRLRAGLTVDRPRDVGPLRKALSAPRHPAVDVAAASDPSVQLRKTLTPA